MAQEQQSSFTGRRRKKKTSLRVKFSDRASAVIITVGGIGTILAVSLVAVVLIAEVWPIFTSAQVEQVTVAEAPWEVNPPQASAPVTSEATESESPASGNAAPGENSGSADAQSEGSESEATDTEPGGEDTESPQQPPADSASDEVETTPDNVEAESDKAATGDGEVEGGSGETAPTPPATEAAIPTSSPESASSASDTESSKAAAKLPLYTAIDEYRLLGWTLYPNGEVQVFRLSDGQQLEAFPLVEEGRVVTFSRVEGTNDVAVGLADGSIRLGQISFETSFLERDDPEVPDELKTLEEEEFAQLGNGMVQVTPTEQFRLTKVDVELGEPIALGDGPIVRLNLVTLPRGKAVAAVFESGEALFAKINEKKALLGNKVTYSAKSQSLPEATHEGRLPDYMFAPGLGDNVYAIWNDGHLHRYDVRNAETVLAETVDLFPEDEADGARVTAAAMLLGRESLLIGDSSGRVRVWFRARNPAAETTDGQWLMPIHDMEPAPAAVTTFGISLRSRMFVAGCEDGSYQLYHATTNQRLFSGKLLAPGSEGNPHGAVLEEPILVAKMTPKDDGLVFATDQHLIDCNMDPAHPEATWVSLFGPLWYEGYERPKRVWQSSSGDVSSEKKLGLWPLIFGTLKATFYAMLFGAPIALMAAIYTSEFLTPSVRGRVKPLIEMMASLPSVVLGFLAALVIAPYVENVVPAVLCAFFTVPLAYLVGSFLWQLVPHDARMYLERFRLMFIFVMMAFGFLFAYALGPSVQDWLFAGDIKMWLDGQTGGAAGGWMLFTLPLSALIVGSAAILGANTYLRKISVGWTRSKFAGVNLVKFLVGVAATIALAYCFSLAMSAVGWDARGSLLDTYEQRNSLIVGVVMGFAIIPIIYTIAEDALSTVPAHLRFASLGAGATPWQTAIRVVVPTAMSGLFSALMIGLGRAVGETMIVLMALGNTSITELNPFSGGRTLSANVAVELPEAAQHDTHYRVLFFTALVLFVMTFAVNTVAELIRIRFRKRAVAL